MFANSYRPMLRCIKCAACMNHCLVCQSVGGHAYAAVYPGPMGSVLTLLLRGNPGDAALASATSACGRRDSVCPVEIPLTELMRDLRSDAPASRPVRTQSNLSQRAVHFITGPSRTADVEQTIQSGAHGPITVTLTVY